MTAIRCARPVTTSMWCSTMSTVFRSCSFTERISSTSCGTCSADRPAIGSSRSSTGLSAASSIAISSRRLSPCGRPPAGTSAFASSPTRANAARVGLEAKALVPAGGLPHGDKRRLEIAMLLAADKPVLLLDEPMAGLSAEHVPQLVELIRSVNEQERKTVLMVEHHMDVVTGLAHRIAVMHHGALLACDTPAAVMANETVQSAYLGEAL